MVGLVIKKTIGKWKFLTKITICFILIFGKQKEEFKKTFVEPAV